MKYEMRIATLLSNLLLAESSVVFVYFDTIYESRESDTLILALNDPSRLYARYISVYCKVY